MTRDDGAELESLKREVRYLRSEHVALGHEHSKEMNEKEGMLAKRLKRAEKAEQLVTTLKRGRNELQLQLRAANDQLEESGLELGHLKREVKLLRTRSAEAKARVADLELALAKDPNAKLRFKIKTLCLKYRANTQQQKGEGPAKLELWLWNWCSIQLRSILISRNPYGVIRLRTPGCPHQCPHELSAE